MDKLFGVSDAIVILTGVSGKLGFEYAKAFLTRQSRVIGLDVQSSADNEALLQNFPEKYHFYKADVCDRLTLTAVLEDVLKQYGVPTVLLNNAGIDASPNASEQENGLFAACSDATGDKVMDVNLIGVYLCGKVFGWRTLL